MLRKDPSHRPLIHRKHREHRSIAGAVDEGSTDIDPRLHIHFQIGSIDLKPLDLKYADLWICILPIDREDLPLNGHSGGFTVLDDQLPVVDVGHVNVRQLLIHDGFPSR